MNLPWGAQLVNYIFHSIPHFPESRWLNFSYKVMIWILMYLTYMFYHMARKSFSIVKPVLAPNCSHHHHWNDSSDPATGWAPFDDNNHCKTLLGGVDYSFAFSYGVSLFFSGLIADRVNVRYYLTLGLIGGGIATGLLGVAYFAEIHRLYYFILMQMLNGILQSTGWPAVMAVMGNWFGISGRGIVMGFWNSHVFVGNILGTFISGAWAKNSDGDWGWSFIVPGFIMMVMGGVIFLFLVIDPGDVDLPSPKHNNTPTAVNGSINTQTHNVNETSEDQPLLIKKRTKVDNGRMSSCLYRVLINGGEDGAVGIFQALMIPGVIEFSLSLFFTKLVNYTFLFWLPFYIKNNPINSDTLSNNKSFHFSMLFDVGGIIGGIGTGIFSDLTGARAFTCVINQYLSVPILYLYLAVGEESDLSTIVMLLVIGYFINGPISLIATAVSSDLGTHKSLQNSQKAKATVSAIINATGTVGAALGPLLAGLISDSHGWNSVFYLLMASCFTSALFLTRLVIKECFMFKKKLTTFLSARTL